MFRSSPSQLKCRSASWRTSTDSAEASPAIGLATQNYRRPRRQLLRLHAEKRCRTEGRLAGCDHACRQPRPSRLSRPRRRRRSTVEQNPPKPSQLQQLGTELGDTYHSSPPPRTSLPMTHFEARPGLGPRLFQRQAHHSPEGQAACRLFRRRVRAGPCIGLCRGVQWQRFRSPAAPQAHLRVRQRCTPVIKVGHWIIVPWTASRP